MITLAQKACDHGWSGLVIFGCIRDVDIISKLPIGVMALAAHPMKSVKRGIGRTDEKLFFAGVEWVPGHYLYADNNGVLAAPERIDLETFSKPSRQCDHAAAPEPLVA